MAKAARVHLKPEERLELERIVEELRAGKRKVQRARVLLLLDRSQGEKRLGAEVAAAVGVSLNTVSKLARRYVSGGLEEALEDRPRSGRPPKITGEVEAQLIALVCQKRKQGTGQARWTMRLLANKLVELELVDKISHVAVMKRLKKISSNPGRFRAGASPPRPAHRS